MHPLNNPLFIDFCTYFNGNQDYFECHEVLEEYWKLIAPRDKEHPLVAYIQLATGLYHWRRNQFDGANRILKKAYKKLIASPTRPFFEYIDYPQLCNDCNQSIIATDTQQPFQAFQLKIIDPTLEKLVLEKINSLPSIPHEFLLHKHMLRDRSDILTKREEKRKGRR